MNIVIRQTKDISKEEVLILYKSNQWSAADKPDTLFQDYYSHILWLPLAMAIN